MRLTFRIGFLFAISACGVALAEQPAPTATPAPSTTIATTTTTSTVPPTTTTTLPALTFAPKCPNLIPYARAAGFPETELEMLDFIAYRESRCSIQADGTPRCAHNADDPGSGPYKGSWGPWQTNQGWTTRNRWNPHPAGYLGGLGILNKTTDLCDWGIAAKAAKALWDYSIATHGWDKRWYQWRT